MPKVYVARCEDYEYEHVERAIRKGIDALGGIKKLIGTNKKVAIKPNLLKSNVPEDCVTTHPVVVRGVLESVINSGNTATIVESAAGTYARKNMRTIYASTGMVDVALQTGATLNDNFQVSEAHIKHGRSVKNLRIIKSILDADTVISAAKLKTHTMMTYTGAVKNLFGVVPGLSKAECHFRLPDSQDFAAMLVDIAEFIRPSLSVIDAVWGMEGEGPSAGTPRKIGAVIISDCPYSADIVAGHLINLDWRDNPVIKNAVDRGLCEPNNIEIIGDPIDELIVNDFAKPPVYHANVLQGRVPKFLEEMLGNMLVLYPKFNKTKCVGCAICAKSCPNGAITMIDNLPQLETEQCINCFCCHELCPQKAVEIRRPFVLRAATRLFK